MSHSFKSLLSSLYSSHVVVVSIALLVLSTKLCPAQIQTHSYSFLNAPSNARLAALGGVNVSLADRDINFFFSNPALTGDTLAGFASANYQFYVADIGNSAFSYGHNFNRIGMLAFGVQHINYGTITSYDATGHEIGDFKAGETTLVLSKVHQANNFRMGVNLKAGFSNLAGFRSSALLFDIGGVFIHPEKALRVGLVFKNLGFILSEYSGTSNTTLPFDVQAGATFKPENMPLRFSITAYNLFRSGLIYENNTGDGKPGTLDNVLRRFNFAAEVLIHRNVNVMLGYNHLIHQELKLEDGGGGAGISLGFSAHVKSVDIVVSRSGFVAGSAGYGFTVAANVDRMLMR